MDVAVHHRHHVALDPIAVAAVFAAHDHLGAHRVGVEPALLGQAGIAGPHADVLYDDVMGGDVDAEYHDEKYPERRDILRAKWRRPSRMN